jgi:DegV family protein with EDD domain
MAVGIVTDSASDLPPELAAREGIIVVPLEVRLEGHSPEEMAAVSGDGFWELQRSSSDLAQTAAPSPGEFAEAFRALDAAGAEGICCVTISSALSATYQAALAGAALVEDLHVEVVDSRSATMGEGLIVLEAAAAARAGGDLTAVVTAARGAVERSKVLGTLDTLENLRRGGRIGSAQALLGSLLSIKPVVEIRDGVVEGESKQRTRSRSLAYLADRVMSGPTPERVAIVHAAASDVTLLIDQLAPIASADEIIVTSIGPVIGAHTGLGTIGVCWLEPVATGEGALQAR